MVICLFVSLVTDRRSVQVSPVSHTVTTTFVLGIKVINITRGELKVLFFSYQDTQHRQCANILLFLSLYVI